MVGVLVLQLALVRGFRKDPGLHGLLSGEPAEVRTSDLIEELGQVKYVFTDKTGTLTLNQMAMQQIVTADGAASDERVGFCCRDTYI